MAASERQFVPFANVHPSIVDQVGGSEGLAAQAQAAVAENDVVVLGMKQNPVVKAAKKLLDNEGIAYKYLEWGSYVGGYRDRLELKMWTGWKTFPMVFVKGVFVGGFDDLKRLHDAGELKPMLEESA